MIPEADNSSNGDSTTLKEKTLEGKNAFLKCLAGLAVVGGAAIGTVVVSRMNGEVETSKESVEADKVVKVPNVAAQKALTEACDGKDVNSQEWKDCQEYKKSIARKMPK